MSTSSKGAELERKAIAILEADGYLVHRAVRTPYQRNGVWRCNSNDVFGVADLVALKRGEPVLFVQVGTPTNRAAKRKKAEPVARHADSDAACFEVWSWHGGSRSKGGQRFDVQGFNGLEWAPHCDRVCIPAEKKATAA